MTRRAIRTLDITSVTIVGADRDVHPRVLHQLRHLGAKVHRVRSSDRYEISAQLAERAATAGAQANHPIVTSGASWASSVTAPTIAAILGQVMLLVDDDTMAGNTPAAHWLSQHRQTLNTVKLVGGVHAIGPQVEAQLEHVAAH